MYSNKCRILKVLATPGSTRKQSSNLQWITAIAAVAVNMFQLQIFEWLDRLPHFNPDIDEEAALPDSIKALRVQIMAADSILICTPEYIFSLPGSLKNLLEWTVATTIFSGKPVALVAAALSGEKALESLQVIMRTLGATFTEQTSLLIPGARAKMNAEGEVSDAELLRKITALVSGLNTLMLEKYN